MKAIQYTDFGDSSVLKLSDVAMPANNDDEVLIKITSTTVNPLDMKIRSGNMQKMMPVQLPYIPGSDISGVADAVGKNVTHIKRGDAVFAINSGGSYAEYVAVNGDRVALKPENLSANEAAALAVPINTSYTVLVENMHLQKGQTLLIHGAAGAVGSVMTQMAKALGAHVIATASGPGVKLAKELGADEAIDHKTQDFTSLVKDVDLVADLVGGETQKRSFDVLKKGGTMISIVMPPSAEMAEKYGVTAKFISSNPSRRKLEYGKQLVEEGKIKPGIAKVMKLEQAAEAQDLLSKGGLNGKIILETH